MSRVTSSALVSRMIRAARLDSDLYEEVEADRDATSQAAIVVVIAAVCAGIGAGIRASMSGNGGVIGSVIGAVVFALLSWVIWSYVTYFIGTRLFGGTATPGELLRTIGFANSPGVFYILGFIPGLGGLIRLVVYVWLLVAGVIAVRQALDFDTGKAIMTTVIGWLVPLILLFILGIVGLGAAFALS